MSTNLWKSASLGTNWIAGGNATQSMTYYSGAPFVEWDNVTFLNDTQTPWVKMWAPLYKLFPVAPVWPDANVFGALDAQITLARQYGFGVLLTVHHYFPEFMWTPGAVGGYRSTSPPSVAPGSYWAQMIEFVLRRYSQYNPNRPNQDCYIHALEVLNEPNLVWTDISATAAGQKAADAMATAKQIVNSAGNPMVVGGPSTWDGTGYNTFNDAVLARLQTNGFYTTTANHTSVVWTQHNYYDALDHRPQLASSDAVSKLNAQNWRGWPTGQLGAGEVFITEGLIDRKRISGTTATKNSVQASGITEIMGRLYSGPDSPQIRMATQYLFYNSDAVTTWDSGLLDEASPGNTPPYRTAYDRWKVASGAGWPPAPATWHPWLTLSGQLGSQPEIVSFSSEHTDVIGRGIDNHLYHRWRNDKDTWSNWEGLGGSIAGAPSVVSWNSNHMDVYARGTSNDLVHIWWDPTNGWHAWESLGGVISGDPYAMSWAYGHIDVFVSGINPGLFHRWYGNGAWQGSWIGLGGNAVGQPSVVSWFAGHQDVFCRWTDGQLWHIWYDGTNWQPWQSLGGGLASDPVAFSWGTGHIDVFIRGTDNAYWHRWYDGTNWQPWQSLGGSFASKPTVTSMGYGHVMIGGVTTNGDFATRYYLNSQWSANWESFGGSNLSPYPRIHARPDRIDIAAPDASKVNYRYFR